ncbi:MAG: hypothetical protein KJ825_10000 [Alphaproteobacteria bacterium]|nr:hypothetical protein [Alphaproteobacteria bacterium]
MQYLLNIVAPLAKAEIRSAKESAERLGVRVAGYVAAGGAATIGVVFLVIVAYLGLARRVPAPDAALIVAGGCFLLAAIIGGTVWAITRQKARQMQSQRNAAKAATMAELQLLQAELELALHKNAKTGTLGMLVAGLAVGASAELRGSLMGLLRDVVKSR